jgi:flagellar FliJ protein
MAPSDRLKPVHNVAERREQTAAKLFGDAQRILKDQESRLEQLLMFQTEYRERFDADMRGGMSATRLQEYQVFMAQLDKAIKQQEAAVEMSRRESNRKKKHWHEKHVRTQAIGKVIDRFRKEENHQQERVEQKESDEYAMRSARRK